MIHPNPEVRMVSDFLDEFESHDDMVGPMSQSFVCAECPYHSIKNKEN